LTPPALDEWMTLRGLDFETTNRRQQAIAAAPTIVAVSADLGALDVEALDVEALYVPVAR
jgi:hypothetical protein